MENFSISVIDLLLVIVTVFFGFFRLFKGVITAIFALLGVSVSYLVATKYYQPVSEKIPLLDNLPWQNLAGFSLLFIFVLLAFAVLGTLLSKASNYDSSGLAKLLSFIMGLVEGFLICSVILWVLHSRDLPNSKALFQNSIFVSYYLDYNPLLQYLDNRLNPNLFH